MRMRAKVDISIYQFWKGEAIKKKTGGISFSRDAVGLRKPP
jgi:hypothetical protein